MRYSSESLLGLVKLSSTELARTKPLLLGQKMVRFLWACATFAPFAPWPSTSTFPMWGAFYVESVRVLVPCHWTTVHSAVTHFCEALYNPLELRAILDSTSALPLRQGHGNMVLSRQQEELYWEKEGMVLSLTSAENQCGGGHCFAQTCPQDSMKMLV